MMTNLFSTFDPATSTNMSMNWMSSMLVFTLLPMPMWNTPNRAKMIIDMISLKLHKEFSLLLSVNSKGMTLMMISYFMFILTNNYMGLLPYVFTSSSHLTFSLTMALPMWLSLMMFGWINHTNHMFSHLVPSGTPSMLMPFMVMIETISNIMRPGSLAVRLTANMIAGHLLMSLLGNNSMNASYMTMIMIFSIQLLLMMFETSVTLIQAYVFSVLSTLYTSEVI
uniref:ATP synthase F0 subunit 6 n=1 Tax=Calacta lugubris TaxID=2880907 RepID=UPI001D117ABD|nr:ATP synthase F0 subunit 6 [Calacta lugubris]UCC45926.1 ATP synthase F0 subunit 6 [Calacta lugubris]